MNIIGGFEMEWWIVIAIVGIIVGVMIERRGDDE
jgi:hypothetical protein